MSVCFPRRRFSPERGFTLIELLVAVVVLALVMVGVLNMLDASSRVSKVESALVDTQENVRYAAYHLTRTVRMAGGAGLPFARDDGGGAAWVMGRVDSNTATVASPWTSDPTGAAGSDSLTLYGFFERNPFFVDAGEDVSGSVVTIRESVNRFDGIPASGAFENRGMVWVSHEVLTLVAVGQVAGGGGALSGTAPDRTLTLTAEAAGGVWAPLNPSGTAFPPVWARGPSRIGILDAYTYWVSPDHTLWRRRSSGDALGYTDEPVAVNIGSLQVALGIDSDDDGVVDVWNDSPTAANAADPNRPVAMRITVLGRTPFPVPNWAEPVATFNVEDMTLSGVDRAAKWRRMQVVAAMRNFMG